MALALALAGAASGASVQTQEATCEKGPVFSGPGAPGWRRESIFAGPVGVHRRPLAHMGRYSAKRPNEFVTKLPLITEGHDAVTLAVPPSQAHRVFLYYGYHEGPGGRRSLSLYDFPGSTTIEFEPCAGKPFTVWPGGLRVKGMKPVRLLVQAEGGPAVTLALGRPKVPGVTNRP